MTSSDGCSLTNLLNDDKTEFIIIGTRQQLKKVTFNILRVGNTQMTSLSQAKNLGSWFDAQMNLNTHVTKCCQAAFFHLFNIGVLGNFSIMKLSRY